MTTMHEKSPDGGTAIASVAFLLTALTAALLLLTAGVIGLSKLLGSFIVAALILGGLFALIALLLYIFSIRPAVARVRAQVDTVYDVAQTVKTGYEWLTEKYSTALQLYDMLLK